MAKTLTTANSALLLMVRGLFPVPQAIQGYAVDDSFAVANVKPTETFMGVDGKLSAGYTPYPTVMTITLQADSASVDMFDAVIANQKANNEALIFDGTLFVQGTQEKNAMTKGFLTDITPTSTAKKTLQPRTFEITWESMTKAPV